LNIDLKDDLCRIESYRVEDSGLRTGPLSLSAEDEYAITVETAHLATSNTLGFKQGHQQKCNVNLI
jgi:hypothetical protein